jgi:hypothetical protein
MNFERLLEQGRLRPHRTSRSEIQQLLRLVDRDLADAQVRDLSSDRRFLIAYEAILALATAPLYCSGYETYGQGHHWITFQCLPDLLGDELRETASYFDLCRTKRNVSAYDRSGQISQAEAEEIISEASEFKSVVHEWLKAEYPQLLE